MSALASLQKKKKDLKTELIQIERQIYDLETSYLEETKDFGNIFTGWDLYVSPDGTKSKAKKAIQNDERHFSLSSITSPASRKEENKKKKPEGNEQKKNKKAKTEAGDPNADEKSDEGVDANGDE